MKKYLKLILIAVILILLAFVIYLKLGKSEQEFTVNSLLLKSVVKQGEFLSTKLGITNLKQEKDFKIEVKNLKDLVFLSESSFRLGVDEEKQISVIFDDQTLSHQLGVYVGKLVISAGSQEKEIPVIIEIQSKKALFATTLDISKEDIAKGDKIAASIKFFNLNDTKTHDIEVTYSIKDFDSKEIFLEKENLAIGTEALITKSIDLPEDAALGDYVFSVTVDYAGSVGSSSRLFSIVNTKESLNLNFFVIVVFAFILGILILVFYLIRERDKMFLELRKQHDREINFVLEKLENEKEKLVAKTKNVTVKRVIVEKFRAVKEKTLKKLRKRHEKQKIELRKLKRRNKKSEMQMKLEQWKKEGFNVNELLGEAKPTIKNIKSQLRKLKKQGYDTLVVEK